MKLGDGRRGVGWELGEGGQRGLCAMAKRSLAMLQPMERALHQRRLKRYEDALHARYLTFSCFKRQPFLTSDRARLWMCDAMTAACEKHAFVLVAWVLMPEHVHLLVVPRSAGQQVGPLLTSMKQSVSRRAVAWVKESTPQFLTGCRM